MHGTRPGLQIARVLGCQYQAALVPFCALRCGGGVGRGDGVAGCDLCFVDGDVVDGVSGVSCRGVVVRGRLPGQRNAPQHRIE